jgi:hypothetical protein
MGMIILYKVLKIEIISQRNESKILTSKLGKTLFI